MRWTPALRPARGTAKAATLPRETEAVLHALGGIEHQNWQVALGAEACVGDLTSHQVRVTGVF